MKQLTLSALFITAVLSLSSCGGASNNDRIADAYAAYDDKNVELAQQQVKEMIDEDSLKGFSCDELCRLSILLMKLSEQGYEEDIASAVHCYYKSFEVDSDSATAYFSSLPVDDAPYITILSALSVSLDPSQESRLRDFEVNEEELEELMDTNSFDNE